MMGTLDNDLQILLLYLADELPPDDRTEISRRLAVDESLAAELDRLAAIHSEIEAGLARLDRVSKSPVAGDAAARHIGREIRQRLARPKVKEPAPETAPRHRMLPWLIPGGIAAAVLVGTMAWVHHQAMVSERELAMRDTPAPQPIEPSTTAPIEKEPNLALLEQSFETSAGDDDAHVVARADSKKDVVNQQDEISSYMLNLEAAH